MKDGFSITLVILCNILRRKIHTENLQWMPLLIYVYIYKKKELSHWNMNIYELHENKIVMV